MSKIKLSTSLYSMDGITKFSGTGILNKQQITFQESNVMVSLCFKNVDDISLQRVTDDYMISMSFQKKLTKDGIYDIKCDSMHIPIEVTTDDIILQDGYIYIVYELVLGGHYQGKFIYEICYEVIE